MKAVKIKYLEYGIKFFVSEYNNELSMGEKIVLITIIRIAEEINIVTKNEICKENNISHSTTYSIIKSLEKKGYIISLRGKQFYSKSYVSLTNKGLLFSYQIKNYCK